MRYSLLVLFAFFLSTGQLLFKKAAMAADGASFWTGLVNPWTVLALAIYAAGTVLWLAILKTTPLSVAYPFTALGFILVPLGARYFYGEVLDARYAMGILCIVAGILLTSTKIGA